MKSITLRAVALSGTFLVFVAISIVVISPAVRSGGFVDSDKDGISDIDEAPTPMVYRMERKS
jgi:hypothetical protein